MVWQNYKNAKGQQSKITAVLREALSMNSDSKNYPTDAHGWAELLAPRAPKPTLKGNCRVPLTVIGAGVTGLACARRLAELNPQKEILLLEAREVGQGSSGRNSGFAVSISQFTGAFSKGQSDSQIGEYRRVNRINQAGLTLLREQVRALVIDCQWDECGYYHVAADQTSIQECEYFERYLQNMGIAHTRYDQDALIEKIGTSHYQCGFHVPEGVLLQPAALVRGLADNLPKNVTLYENSPVLEVEPGAPITLKLATGEVKTDQLFMATNYEVSKLGFLNRYLIGSTLSASLTRVLDKDELASLGTISQWGTLSLHRGGATLRLMHDGRICLRNTAEYIGARLLSDNELAERRHIHRRSFEKRFPQLAHVPFEFSWSGVEGISANGTNFFGAQHQNIYYAGGFNGAGVSKGTAFGAALAEYAGGGQSNLITDCLACAPAKWLPPRPLLDIGAYFTVRSRFKGVGLDR